MAIEDKKKKRRRQIDVNMSYARIMRILDILKTICKRIRGQHNLLCLERREDQLGNICG